jgi:hypothetical protein
MRMMKMVCVIIKICDFALLISKKIWISFWQMNVNEILL